MTNKRGTLKLFTFSFEIDAPNIISCAPKIFSCAPKNLHYYSGSTSAPKLKFKLSALRELSHTSRTGYLYPGNFENRPLEPG